MANPQHITPTQFAHLIGLQASELSNEWHKRIIETDLNYWPLDLVERDAVMLSIIRRVDERAFAVSGAERKGVWEMAWAERSAQFSAQNYSADSLVPQYHRSTDEIIRLERDYVQSQQPGLELRFSNLFRRWLFETYLSEAQSIYEFGCGSGLNLMMLAESFPNKSLWGLDWATSAVDLINTIAQSHHLRLQGRTFDFFAPDTTLEFDPHSAVLTMCALEQIGDGFEPFVQFLLARKPKLVLNMEPLAELYALDNLVDYIGWRYHSARNYLGNYVGYLRELATQGRIELQKIQRVYFGNQFHEGYSYVVWRPL